MLPCFERYADMCLVAAHCVLRIFSSAFLSFEYYGGRSILGNDED